MPKIPFNWNLIQGEFAIISPDTNWRGDDPWEFADWGYGQWRTVKPDDATHVIPNYLSGSDYSGSLVERTNHDVFLEDFGNVPGVLDVSGGHGTFAVAVPIRTRKGSWSRGKRTAEMFEWLEKLNDYPLADEEKLSEMELEAQVEAWNSWAASDFRGEVRDHVDPSGEDEELEQALDDISDDDLYEVFRVAADKANEYWVNESGGEMWIDLKRVAKQVVRKDIIP